MEEKRPPRKDAYCLTSRLELSTLSYITLDLFPGMTPPQWSPPTHSSIDQENALTDLFTDQPDGDIFSSVPSSYQMDLDYVKLTIN